MLNIINELIVVKMSDLSGFRVAKPLYIAMSFHTLRDSLPSRLPCYFRPFKNTWVCSFGLYPYHPLLLLELDYWIKVRFEILIASHPPTQWGWAIRPWQKKMNFRFQIIQHEFFLQSETHLNVFYHRKKRLFSLVILFHEVKT